MSLPLFSVPSGMNRRHATVGITVLVLIWLWVALDRPYTIPKHINWNPYANVPQSAPGSDAVDAFDFPTLDSESIRSICADTAWNSSLVFTCNNSVGGIGNIRNSILNCVRYAISAGASITEPQIIIRDAKDTAIIRTGERIAMEYMFDVPYFYDSVALSCPGLIVYKSLEEVPGHRLESISLQPEHVQGQHFPRTGLAHPEEWRTAFANFTSHHVGIPEGSKAVFELGRSYLSYPIASDGTGFSQNFGKLLKFRRDTRVLATKTLHYLAAKLNYTLDDLAKPYLPQFFMGAHLRTEHDAQLGWPGADPMWKYSRYETQAKLYLEQAQKTWLRDIYVASGEEEEIQKFIGNATEIGANVHTKHSILDGESLGELDALAWDQQGMVDFLVMLKASSFTGIGHSSFAWNIALLRHTVAEQKDHLSGPQLLNDELSTIFGTPNAYPEYAACLWP